MQVEGNKATVVGTEHPATIPAAIADRYFGFFDVLVLVKNLVNGTLGLQFANQRDRFRLRKESSDARSFS